VVERAGATTVLPSTCMKIVSQIAKWSAGANCPRNGTKGRPRSDLQGALASRWQLCRAKTISPGDATFEYDATSSIPAPVLRRLFEQIEIPRSPLKERVTTSTVSIMHVSNLRVRKCCAACDRWSPPARNRRARCPEGARRYAPRRHCARAKRRGNASFSTMTT